jgi:hypothetical protein
MSSSRKKGSRSFSARAKRDLRPHPPTAGSQGREASLPSRKARVITVAMKTESWFGPQPIGLRKTARPFAANRPLEARLTSARARGPWRLDRPGNRAVIARIVAREAARSGVRIAKVAYASTTLKFELAAPRRANLTLFFRAVAGRIPRAVTGTERGRPLAAIARTTARTTERKFWDGLVSTRPL